MGSICISYKADVSNKFFNQTERISSKGKDSLQGKQITLYDRETCAFIKSGKIIDASFYKSHHAPTCCIEVQYSPEEEPSRLVIGGYGGGAEYSYDISVDYKMINFPIESNAVRNLSNKKV